MSRDRHSFVVTNHFGYFKFSAALMLILFLVSAVPILYVWKQNQIRSLLNEIQKIKLDKIKILKENDNLKGEISNLINRQRIEEIAQRELKLIYPKIHQIVLKVPREFQERFAAIDRNKIKERILSLSQGLCRDLQKTEGYQLIKELKYAASK